MPTILVVDDEFLVADVLTFALEDEGYQVLRANNGRKALDVMERERPSLVITDYMMPVMNGLELATAIKGQDRPPPVILMSGAQAHIGRNNGNLFAALFDKPFRIAEVLASIHALVGPGN